MGNLVWDCQLVILFNNYKVTDPYHYLFINTPTIINYSFNEKITDISCGFYHCLILLKNGYVYSFGSNSVKLKIILLI
jgi:alpha-tubulin suppressor-like RCC1 family protein